MTTNTIPADLHTALMNAEITYQTVRGELAAAEQARHRQLHRAYVAAGRDLRTLAAATPPTITRATITGAIRRHGHPTDWAQLPLDLPAA